MVSRIISLLSNALVTNNQRVSNSTAVVSATKNPFANPFVSAENSNYATYAKNKPMQGGYFAGYHNGRPNIVGKRLFIEV